MQPLENLVYIELNTHGDPQLLLQRRMDPDHEGIYYRLYDLYGERGGERALEAAAPSSASLCAPPTNCRPSMSGSWTQTGPPSGPTRPTSPLCGLPGRMLSVSRSRPTCRASGRGRPGRKETSVQHDHPIK
jgi:hypothetical protein